MGSRAFGIFEVIRYAERFLRRDDENNYAPTDSRSCLPNILQTENMSQQKHSHRRRALTNERPSEFSGLAWRLTGGHVRSNTPIVRFLRGDRSTIKSRMEPRGDAGGDTHRVLLSAHHLSLRLALHVLLRSRDTRFFVALAAVARGGASSHRARQPPYERGAEFTLTSTHSQTVGKGRCSSGATASVGTECAAVQPRVQRYPMRVL